MKHACAIVPARQTDLSQWGRAALYVVTVVALFLAAQATYASDGTEFEAATATFQGWVQGNLGKLAALIAIAVGSIVAAVKKDWSWFFGAVVLSIGVGILVGIVNASFTATI